MKKVLFFSLTLALLASCSAETTTPPANEGADTNVTAPEPSPEIDSTPEVEPEVLPDELPMDDGMGVDPEGELPEFVLPTSDNPINNGFAEAIALSRDEENNLYNPIIIDAEDEFGAIIFPMLSFDPSNAQGYAISVSAMMVQAYGIAAVLPVEGQEEVILAGMQQFIDTQVQNFTGYLPDQLEIAQSARLETLADGTILLVMCADQDTVFDNIVANLG